MKKENARIYREIEYAQNITRGLEGFKGNYMVFIAYLIVFVRCFLYYTEKTFLFIMALFLTPVAWHTLKQSNENDITKYINTPADIFLDLYKESRQNDKDF